MVTGARCTFIGSSEARLLGLCDLAEHLLLGIEVVVEGALREGRRRRDVGDARGEEAVALEHLARRLEQPSASPRALRRARTGVGDRGCVRDRLRPGAFALAAIAAVALVASGAAVWSRS